MNSFYDALENTPAAEREADLMAALPTQIDNARTNSPAFAEILAGIDPAVYLTDILLRLDSHPASAIRDILPDRWRGPVAAG